MPDNSSPRRLKVSSVLVSSCGSSQEAEGRYLCVDMDDNGRPIFFNKETGFKISCSPSWTIFSNEMTALYITSAQDREPPLIGWSWSKDIMENKLLEHTQTTDLTVVLTRMRYAEGLNAALHVTHKSPLDKRRLAKDEIASLVIEGRRLETKRSKLTSLLYHKTSKAEDRSNLQSRITEEPEPSPEMSASNSMNATSLTRRKEATCLNSYNGESDCQPKITSLMSDEPAKCDAISKPIRIRKTKSKLKLVRSKSKAGLKKNNRPNRSISKARKVTIAGPLAVVNGGSKFGLHGQKKLLYKNSEKLDTMEVPSQKAPTEQKCKDANVQQSLLVLGEREVGAQVAPRCLDSSQPLHSFQFFGA